MPGPVVNGVRQAGAIGSVAPDSQEQEAMLPLVAEGSIRLILLCSGDVLMARLRHTTDRDGDHAYQLLRPVWCVQPQMSHTMHSPVGCFTLTGGADVAAQSGAVQGGSCLRA